MEVMRGTSTSVGLSSCVDPADIVELFQQICRGGGLPQQVLPPDLTPRTCGSRQAAAVERAVYEVWDCLYPGRRAGPAPQGCATGGSTGDAAAARLRQHGRMADADATCRRSCRAQAGAGPPPVGKSSAKVGGLAELSHSGHAVGSPQEALRDVSNLSLEEVDASRNEFSAGETGGTPESESKVHVAAGGRYCFDMR